MKLLWDTEKAKRRAHGRAGSVEHGAQPGLPDPAVVSPVVGVLGAKGGVGATTLAINLAVALAQDGKTTTLLDANLQQPDAACMIAGHANYSLLELVARAGDLDRKVFEACLTDVAQLGQGLKLLSPPPAGDAAGKVNLTEVAGCLDRIRGFSGLWVLDLPRHLDKHLVTLMDRCDLILLVLEASLTGVAATRRWLDVFAELGYAAGKVSCVLNRSGSREKLVESRLSSSFRDCQLYKIPNAYGIAWDCAARGVPILVDRPKEPYARAVRRLSAAAAEQLARGTARA